MIMMQKKAKHVLKEKSDRMDEGVGKVKVVGVVLGEGEESSAVREKYS